MPTANNTNGLSFSDLLAAVDPPPPPQDSSRSARTVAIARPAARSASISEDDLKAMIGEARRDVRKQSGLIAKVANQVRGDELQRRQYASMLARIDAATASEEAKLGALLVVSLHFLGFQMTTGCLQAMEDYLRHFAPDSAAGRAGRRMLAEQEELLPEFVDQIAERARRRVLRPLNLDR